MLSPCSHSAPQETQILRPPAARPVCTTGYFGQPAQLQGIFLTAACHPDCLVASCSVALRACSWRNACGSWELRLCVHCLWIPTQGRENLGRDMGQDEGNANAGQSWSPASRHACLHSQRWKWGKSRVCWWGDTHWFTALHTALELRKFIEKTWPWLVSANCVPSLTLVETLGWQ